MARTSLRYLRRGKVVTLDHFDPNRTLLDHLRIDRREPGTKEGCNEGDCGACTVVLARERGGAVRYEAVNACICLLGQIDGAELVTVEDLSAGGNLHPVQQAMVEHHGSQCGFCTPGIAMSLFSLYQSTSGAVSRQAINDCLAGNLCRCTGYRPIVAAAMAACGGGRGAAADPTHPTAGLAVLADDDDLFVGDDQRFFALPRSLAGLHALLAQYPDAIMVGGATDVGLWITKRLQDMPRIIGLGRLNEIDFVEETDAFLRVGAGVRLVDAASALGKVATDLGEVMRRFGSTQVRNAGTIGGNIANGSPIGDLAPCLIALGSEVVLERRGVQRTLALEKFFISYGKQDRASDELVHSLIVPKVKKDHYFKAFKVSKRQDDDISAVLAAFHVELAGQDIGAVRIAFGGMAATPKRAMATEKALAGARIDDPRSWEEAIEQLGADFQPLSDARASAAYRLATARALLQKCLFEISGVPMETTRITLPLANRTGDAAGGSA